MKYAHAKHLHNGDQIRVKETGETTTVISAEVSEKDVFVHAMTSQNGYSKLHHRDIQ